MAVQFSSNYTHRQYYYTQWLAAWRSRGGAPQGDSSDGTYQKVWFYDAAEIHYCLMWLSGCPVTDPNYTQEQNDADLADFTANVLTSSIYNAVVVPRSINGREQNVFTITKYTNSFSLRVFSFQTSNPSSLHCSKPGYNGASVAMTDVYYKCFDEDGADVTDSASTAVVTQVDVEPSSPYEVVGGWLDVPDASREAIVLVGPGLWYVSAVGIPDIPVYSGGSIPFIYEVDIALLPSSSHRVEGDGEATQYLKPTIVNGTNYHTNKLRYTFKHPAGGQAWFQVFLRTFV